MSAKKDIVVLPAFARLQSKAWGEDLPCVSSEQQALALAIYQTLSGWGAPMSAKRAAALLPLLAAVPDGPASHKSVIRQQSYRLAAKLIEMRASLDAGPKANDAWLSQSLSRMFREAY